MTRDVIRYAHTGTDPHVACIPPRENITGTPPPGPGNKRKAYQTGNGRQHPNHSFKVVKSQPPTQVSKVTPPETEERSPLVVAGPFLKEIGSHTSRLTIPLSPSPLPITARACRLEVRP